MIAGPFSPVDWSQAFAFDTPILEIVVRGSAIYLALFALLRGVLKRQAGTVGITDLLVVVLIADAAQNAMAAEYTSVGDGLVLVATIVFWSFSLDWLGYHVPSLEWLLHPGPLPLVKDGRILHRNMRQELITKEELMTHLREQGVDEISKVKRACMEGDGRISVVTDEPSKPKAPERKVS